MKETATTAYYLDEESEITLPDSQKRIQISKKEDLTDELGVSKYELDLVDVSRYKKTEVKKRIVAHVSTKD